MDGLEFDQIMSVMNLPLRLCCLELYVSAMFIVGSFGRRNGENVTVQGVDILESQGFRVNWLWYDQIGLAGLCVLYLVLGYITLRAIKKEK